MCAYSFVHLKTHMRSHIYTQNSGTAQQQVGVTCMCVKHADVYVCVYICAHIQCTQRQVSMTPIYATKGIYIYKYIQYIHTCVGTTASQQDIHASPHEAKTAPPKNKQTLTMEGNHTPKTCPPDTACTQKDQPQQHTSPPHMACKHRRRCWNSVQQHIRSWTQSWPRLQIWGSNPGMACRTPRKPLRQQSSTCPDCMVCIVCCFQWSSCMYLLDTECMTGRIDGNQQTQ
jgi:hypothetical protein